MIHVYEFRGYFYSYFSPFDVTILISNSSSLYGDVQIHTQQVKDEHTRVIHKYSVYKQSIFSKREKIILHSQSQQKLVFGENFWHCCKNTNPFRKKLILQGLIQQYLVLVKKNAVLKLCWPGHVLLPHWCHWPYICLRRVLESIKKIKPLYWQNLALPMSYREKVPFHLSRAYFLFNRPSCVHTLPIQCKVGFMLLPIQCPYVQIKI